MPEREEESQEAVESQRPKEETFHGGQKKEVKITEKAPEQSLAASVSAIPIECSGDYTSFHEVANEWIGRGGGAADGAPGNSTESKRDDF